MPKDFGAFRRFLRAARGRSQEDIVIEFLASTVLNDPVSDNGSVLINHPQRKLLITFNEGNFLFEKKLLDPRRGEAGPRRSAITIAAAARMHSRSKCRAVLTRHCAGAAIH